jgi:hypothetical protein
MKIGTVFMLGIISGAVVVALWRREIRAYAAESTARIRAKAADGMRTVEEKTASVRDRTEQRVGKALRAGQKAIRPAATTGKA